MGWLKKKVKRKRDPDKDLLDIAKKGLDKAVDRGDAAKKKLCDMNDTLEDLMNATLEDLGGKI